MCSYATLLGQEYVFMLAEILLLSYCLVFSKPSV